MTDNRFTLHHGDSAEVLKQYPDNHFDSVVTDPPYGIDFLGKAWDSHTGSQDLYRECLRVLKPGGHLLAFSAARMYHHLAMNVELAGFEIRDQIMWIYSSGFPKSQDVGRSIDRSLKKKDPNFGSYKGKKQASGLVDNFGVGSRCKKCDRTFNTEIIQNCKEEPCGMRYTPQTDAGKQWSGWGTALKPAHEPIVVARKPIKLSVAKNVQVWGIGALNIDATRIEYDEESKAAVLKHNANGGIKIGVGIDRYNNIGGAEESNGEKVLLNELGRFPANVLGEIPDYQKYFYCPKVSRKERHIGFDNLPARLCGPGGTDYVQAQDHQRSNTDRICATDAFDRSAQGPGGNATAGNNHPTVKPQALMEYLIKLVTPPNGKVLDPFNGSGSTGMAAVKLGHHYTGIDLDEKYIEISRKRITAWNQESNLFNTLFDENTK